MQSIGSGAWKARPGEKCVPPEHRDLRKCSGGARAICSRHLCPELQAHSPRSQWWLPWPSYGLFKLNGLEGVRHWGPVLSGPDLTPRILSPPGPSGPWSLLPWGLFPQFRPSSPPMHCCNNFPLASIPFGPHLISLRCGQIM